MSAIRFDGVTKRFGDTVAVDGLDLEVEKGRVLLAAGQSGCGKPHASHGRGLRAAQRGTYTEGGRSDGAPIQAHLNTVFQDTRFRARMSGQRCVRAQAAEDTQEEIRTRVGEA